VKEKWGLSIATLRVAGISSLNEAYNVCGKKNREGREDNHINEPSVSILHYLIMRCMILKYFWQATLS